MSAGVEIIAHVVVRGRVQGVGYRAFVEYEAERLGLQGWVRNRRDGTVEALFAGGGQTVHVMIEICRNGPSGARVDRLDRREGSADELSLRGSVAFAVLQTV